MNLKESTHFFYFVELTKKMSKGKISFWEKTPHSFDKTKIFQVKDLPKDLPQEFPPVIPDLDATILNVPNLEVDCKKVKIVWGKQTYQFCSPINRCKTNNLWDLSMSKLSSNNMQCYLCNYIHARKTCPLVKCNSCGIFGHSQQICPGRRITASKKKIL